MTVTAAIFSRSGWGRPVKSWQLRRVLISAIVLKSAEIDMVQIYSNRRPKTSLTVVAPPAFTCSLPKRKESLTQRAPRTQNKVCRQSRRTKPQRGEIYVAPSKPECFRAPLWVTTPEIKSLIAEPHDSANFGCGLFLMFSPFATPGKWRCHRPLREVHPWFLNIQNV